MSLVSIIVPIYKVEKYLNKCLISIVNQTYSNLQIILVDDGSPDNCPSICDLWAKKDTRIQVIHKENGGLSDARNAGLSKAKGEYVLFVDSDDWISLNMVDTMVKTIEKNNADMVICQYAVVYPDGRIEQLHYQGNKEKILSVKEALRLLLEDKEITNHVWRKLYKRSLLPDNLFPVEKNYEDIYVMADLFIKCKKIVNINEVLYFYLLNDNGIVKNIIYKNCLDHYESLLHSYMVIRQIYPELEENIQVSKWKSGLGLLNDLRLVHDEEIKAQQLSKRIVLELNDISHQITICKKELVEYYILKIVPTFFEYAQKVERKRKLLVETFSYCKKLYQEIHKSDSKKFYIIGAPFYGNLGDQALFMGECKFIKDNFPEYEIVYVLEKNINFLLLFFLKFCIKKNDIVSIQAGGNIGTLYLEIHKKQELAIKYFRKHFVVIFPQTYYYSNNEEGKKLLNKTVKVYNSCKNLLVTVREKKSFDFVQKNMPNIKSMLLPDIALYISPIEKKYKRHGVLLALRNDKEKTLKDEDYEILLKMLKDRFDMFEQTDTHVHHSITEDDGQMYLNNIWNKMAKAELVVTDRLHGMIFAALTLTPCIVILSQSHKIIGCYEWIKHLPYIKLVENLNDISKKMDEVLSVKDIQFDNKEIKEKYKLLVNELKKWH